MAKKTFHGIEIWQSGIPSNVAEGRLWQVGLDRGATGRPYGERAGEGYSTLQQARTAIVEHEKTLARQGTPSRQKQDWTPVSIYSSFMRSAAEAMVEGMRDRYPGLDWTVEERSRSIREEPYVEHTRHLVVPKWQATQGKRVIRAFVRGGGR